MDTYSGVLVARPNKQSYNTPYVDTYVSLSLSPRGDTYLSSLKVCKSGSALRTSPTHSQSNEIVKESCRRRHHLRIRPQRAPRCTSTSVLQGNLHCTRTQALWRFQTCRPRCWPPTVSGWHGTSPLAAAAATTTARHRRRRTGVVTV